MLFLLSPGLMPRRTRATPELREEICRLHGDGISPTEIAKRVSYFRRGVFAVLAAARKAGDPRAAGRLITDEQRDRVLQLVAAGSGYKHAAATTGLSEASVHRILKAARKEGASCFRPGFARVSAEQREAICAARAQGQTYPQIAQALGVSERAVGRALARARSKGDSRAAAGRRTMEIAELVCDLYRAGRSYAEIQAATDLPETTIAGILHRARQAGDPRAKPRGAMPAQRQASSIRARNTWQRPGRMTFQRMEDITLDDIEELLP